MKTLRILGLLLIAGVLFSCEKDIEKDQIKQDVVFGIDHIDPYELKSDAWDIDCPENLVPEKAHIIINGVHYYPEVFQINGKWYSQAIKLAPGTYTIEYFALVVSDGNNGYIAIMATPAQGSDYEVYIPENKRIGREFTVNDFEKTEIEVAVLCYEKAHYEPFGFTWFYINRIVVREIAFFGDLCMKDASAYEGSLYDGQPEFPADGGFYDAPAIFEIRVFKDEQPTEIPVFSNASWLGVGEPLKVQYPDNIDVLDEEFTFELWILVKVGDEFKYVHFHTWTLTDDEEIPTDDFGVVDFVVGSCLYNASPETLILPPYQNLPETADASIEFDYEDGGYWTITISSVYPLAPLGGYDFPTNGTYLGWCGDATETINSGSHTFNLYSSLNNVIRPWPAGMPANITLESLAKVNWLMNNLTSFGYPALTGMFVEPDDLDITADEARALQHAIWLILGFDPTDSNQWPGTNQGGGTPSDDAEDMAYAAEYKGDFVPLPGGYAAVLMVADDDPANNQLIFTMVDP